MKIQQLSVFLENKPGRLSEPCKVLKDAGINVLTLALADTQQFGILRLIVKDADKARQVLEAAGCVVNVTEVVATEVEDKPGGLADLLMALETAEVNIEYMYAFTVRREDQAVLIFRFEDPDAAVNVLQDKGFNVVGGVDLYERASG
jgi:hypothetical protein